MKEEKFSSTTLWKIPEEIPNPIQASRVSRRQLLVRVLTESQVFLNTASSTGHADSGFPR